MGQIDWSSAKQSLCKQGLHDWQTEGSVFPKTSFAPFEAPPITERRICLLCGKWQKWEQGKWTEVDEDGC